jgi:hypothetical protein
VAREGLEVADVFRHIGPAFRDQNQANRVKELCGNEAREELIVPSGDFSANPH